MPKLIVTPCTRAVARRICADHKHAAPLPNSSKVYMLGYVDGKLAGLAVWGYGIMPRQTASHLFGEQGHMDDYLELCRFFTYDWVPKNTSSQFLSFTHRILRKHVPHVKWLYTYAAGFQGLIGTIYQASNYYYIGTRLAQSFWYKPGLGLIHDVAAHHRYGSRARGFDRMVQIFGDDLEKWFGYNFRYIYWLCDEAEKNRLMSTATFEILPYPTEANLEIWTKSRTGKRTDRDPKWASTVPIVQLPTRRAAEA